MGYIKSIVDYFEREGAERQMSCRLSARERVLKLHNIIYKLFYNTDKTPFELMITFDNKKVNVDAYEDIHIWVRLLLNEYTDYFNYFVIREWSEQGTGRLHYHGLIQQIKGGQTMMAKLKAHLKRVFGRMSYIKFISYPESYISYMLKRTFMEEDELTEEWFSSYLMKTYYMTDEYELEHENRYYSWTKLVELQNKRTKKD